MTVFKYNPVKIAESVQKTGNFLYIKSHFFRYKKEGVFQQQSALQMHKIIKDSLNSKYRESWGREVAHCMAADCQQEPNLINANKDLINLKNGMFDLKTMKLTPHAPSFLSTIQLPVSYHKDATCVKWALTLDQIFMGKQWKIKILQEFLGYCLTTDNSHQKALINYGQGANGKSLIFNIFNKILGPSNISSVPVSQLDKRHYLAEMFGKLANLSLESEANLEINDANFKAIVSGDLITVDEKYGKPYSFKPFCKLIFAMNTLPYVGDKTSAFYRRVLILSYDREFTRVEQNLKLFHELCLELDGIFLWMLQGLKRLEDQGHFTEDAEMSMLLEEYKRDNNPAMSFVSDNLVQESNSMLPKKEVYRKYCDWSKENGYKAVSDKNLSKNIKKQFANGVVEHRTGSARFWRGLGWVAEDGQEGMGWE